MHLQSKVRRDWRPLLLTLALSGIAPLSAAATPVIEPLPRSEVARERVLADTEHAVVIGNIRRINNQVRAEREVFAEGELLRISWLIPSGHTAREAMAHAVKQLQQHPHTTLFFCEGRECGSSSLWANQVLGYSRLYGPEENQSYLALRLDDEPQRFISLYAITRGNRQVYLHLDQLTPEPAVTDMLYPTPATLGKIIHAEGELLISAATPDDSDSAVTEAWLDLTARMLRSDNRLRIEVNGAQAPAFVQSLLDRGINQQRLEIGEPQPEMGIRLEKR
ncbi:Type IIA topoisomerase (DNA gyrase/topo II, topoisomerase IV), A subunit [Pseudomonas saudimassiliensis]|uniref:Type IIA topoisomerase (DNA gyrase/topo II, topoisomerase IV), A subunit n=1 Tax=Pseudomonas saudimassiliensis TaxID=1461581 RepID=A0A078M4G8_9PSED|nr:DUF4892 domain-containing protein [Pseudomonas saudimassiliensis]CEA01170.1 Type IIA topoisomerase (DNA gyrase/topo II, topoisomerase IV), A subunit [Pseudomonas saudimassiliensis]CEF25422.1 Type IIA topoisomerase (DNA gyrase/topo II, topoisomerase IV), A subunit [Pseudomonas saudimassiliensis]